MKKKIIAMIPARIGSERLKFKNLALLNNKPLIYYAINSAKKSNVFNKIILNSDNLIFNKIAKRYKIDFYLRPKSKGSSQTKSDDVVYDFLLKNPNFDIVVWVNTVAPLQDFTDITNVTNFFIKNKLDSLITTEDKFAHSLFKNRPINYKPNTKFERTQDLTPIKIFSYSLMMWRVKKFMEVF